MGGTTVSQIVGALFSALAYVGVRSLANSEHPLVVVLYFPLVSLPISIPFVLMHPVFPTNVEWLMLLGVGLFSQFAQVFFAGLWGWLLLGEAINQWTFIGAVMLASLSLSFRARSLQHSVLL
eukprot:gene7407-9878_t